MGTKVIVIEQAELDSIHNEIQALKEHTLNLGKLAMNQNNDEIWLTMSEAAAFTKLHPRTLGKYQKEIGYSQPTGNKDIRFKMEDLKNWFYNHYIKSRAS